MDGIDFQLIFEFMDDYDIVLNGVGFSIGFIFVFSFYSFNF